MARWGAADALDPIGPLYELAFDIKAERHAARAFCEDSGLRRVTKNSEARQRISLVRRGAVRAIQRSIASIGGDHEAEARTWSSETKDPSPASAGALTLSFTAAGDDHEEDAGVRTEQIKTSKKRPNVCSRFSWYVPCNSARTVIV